MQTLYMGMHRVYIGMYRPLAKISDGKISNGEIRNGNPRIGQPRSTRGPAGIKISDGQKISDGGISDGTPGPGPGQ